jgi:hypothetical protein
MTQQRNKKNVLIDVMWIEFQSGSRLIIFLNLTVASEHSLHLTTCCSRLFEMSIMAWQTLQVTMGTPPCEAAVYGGGNSSGPMGDTVAWCPPPPVKIHQNQPPLATLVGGSTDDGVARRRRRHGRRSGRHLPTTVCHPFRPRTPSPGGRKLGANIAKGSGWVFEGGRGHIPRLSWCNKGCRSSPMFDS